MFDRNKYYREYYSKNKEQFKQYHKDYYSENKEQRSASSKKYQQNNPERVILYAARNRAKRDELPFDIELGDIIIPEICPILGIKLESSFGKGRVDMDSSPSIDKKIPNLGYTKGNIQIISFLANRMKQNANTEQLVLFSKWVLANYA